MRQETEWGGAGQEAEWGGVWQEAEWGGAGQEAEWGGARSRVGWVRQWGSGGMWHRTQTVFSNQGCQRT